MPEVKKKKQERINSDKPRVAPKEPLVDEKTDYWNKRILEGPLEQKITAIKEAGEKKDVRSLEPLAKFLVSIDDVFRGVSAATDSFVVAEYVEYVADTLKKIFEDNVGNPEITRILPILEEGVESKKLYISVPLLEALELIGSPSIELLKKIIINYPSLVQEDTEVSLVILGLSKKEIAKIKKKAKKQDPTTYLSEPCQIATYDLIIAERDIKRIVFENAKVLDVLPDRQAWVTINEPQLAMKVLKLTLEKLGDKRSSLENILSATLGVKIKQLGEAQFTYYADEILDIVTQVVRNSKLKDDKELSGLLSKIKYGDDVKLRYIKRERSDLTLGDKCGDCTATGSIHFGDSVMWFVNPAYQILKMSKGRRFIGKINFTLGTLGKKDAMIIDALEFNPQAQEGKPYYNDGLECFDAALEFLRDLAKMEKRELFALTSSNSSGAVEMLRKIELKRAMNLEEETVKNLEYPLSRLTLLMPSDDIKQILVGTGYKGRIKLFYQILETTAVGSGGGKDLIDEKLPELEQQVLNPAQILNPEIAAAMRERDFDRAASLILSDIELDKKVKEILGLPDVKLAPKFLSEKIGRIYGTGSADMDSLKRKFLVVADNFVKL